MWVSLEINCTDRTTLFGVNIETRGGTENALYWDDASQKIDHFLCMSFLCIEKVKTIFDFFDGDRVFMSVMFEDQLLQEQECSLVRNLLPYLEYRFPSILRGQFCAIGALSMLNDVFHFEHLLDDGGGEDLVEKELI